MNEAKQQSKSNDSFLSLPRVALLGIIKSFLYEIMALSDFPLLPIHIGAKTMLDYHKVLELVDLGCPRSYEQVEQLRRSKK